MTSTGFKFRRRHLGKIAEAADDRLQIFQLGAQRGRGLEKDFVKLLGVLLARALQIFHGQLEREERIFQFVREPPRQFAPRGDAFGLHQAFALLGKLARHFVERLGKLADFIARMNLDARLPAPCGDFAGARGKLLDRARDARRNPPAQNQSQEDHAAANQQRQRANEIEHLHQVLPRTADQQNPSKSPSRPTSGMASKFSEFAPWSETRINRPAASSRRVALHLGDQRREKIRLAPPGRARR